MSEQPVGNTTVSQRGPNPAKAASSPAGFSQAYQDAKNKVSTDGMLLF